MRESYLSSSLNSAEKPTVTNFSKQVNDFMKGSMGSSHGKSKDSDDEDSSSLSKSAGGELGKITQMYEKYKKMQELMAKYQVGEFDESATISRSQ